MLNHALLRKTAFSLLCAATLTMVACGTSSSSNGAAQDSAPPPEQSSIDNELGTSMLSADRCDPIDPQYCLFPWPNDYFTVDDASSDTGKRLNLKLLSMPKNVLAKPITPTEWNRNDGFSPGQLILARVPDLDLKQTGAVPITNLADAYRKDQAIVVIDADTLERQLIWSELDANITKFTICDSPKPVEALGSLLSIDQLNSLLSTITTVCSAVPLPDSPLADPGPALMIRAGKNYEEGHRYIVALRNLKNADGETLEAPAAFRVFRDNHVSSKDALNARRPHMEALFAKLGKAGIARDSLYLAWDFTVASERNISERALHIRDEAFAKLGDAAPTYTIDTVTDHTAAEDADVAREVTGTLTVPSYMTLANGRSGSRFYYGGDNSLDALPQINPGNPTMTAPFTCMIPRAAFGDADAPAAATQAVPARPSLYGHGLLGSHDEVGAGNVRDMAQEHNMTFCAVDWIGMASDDILNVALDLLDMSHFPTLPDRGQQGFLNFMFLGRAMITADGLCANAAFQVNGNCVIDRSELYYDGNSQGGIMGGSLVALSPDIRAG
ncbi:MAG TPA: hypothetical protein VIR56_10760, partial [Solimonas sp.]